MRTFFSVLAHLFHPRLSNRQRARILHLESLLSLCLVAVGFFGTVHMLSPLLQQYGAVLGYASSITADQVLNQTNAQRRETGVVPLKLSNTLSQAALAKGENMFAEQYWAHTSPSGKEPWVFIKSAGYSYVVAGENLARDFLTTDDMVHAWMNSPTHKANIMNPQFTEIGIAVVNGKLNGTETTLVVQMFGKPQSGIAQVLPRVPTVEAQESITSSQPEETQQVQGVGEMDQTLIVFSPLYLSKAFFLALIFLLIGVLLYDAFVFNDESTSRMVGKNFGHIIFLSVVAYLLLYFKGGIVG